jgi:hypothetical protein
VNFLAFQLPFTPQGLQSLVLPLWVGGGISDKGNLRINGVAFYGKSC